MPLYKYTVTDNIYAGGACIPKGASVEVPIAPATQILPKDAQAAFVRKYGIEPTIGDVQCKCKREELR